MSALAAPTLGKREPLGLALELLGQLNAMRTEDGRALSGCVTAEGFEPWWFNQDHVFWNLLLPYARQRQALRAVFEGSHDAASLPEEALAVCNQLAAELRLAGVALPTHRGGDSWSAAFLGRALRWLSRCGLGLFSLASLVYFRLARRDTLLYIVDNLPSGKRYDFRLLNLYGELRARGYRYFEYVHLRGARDAYSEAWRHLVGRRRPVMFFEILARARTWLTRDRGDALLRLPVAGGSAAADTLFLSAVASWILRRATESVLEIASLRSLLAAQRVRRAVILDDGRHVHPLVTACKLEGIPTMGFQHGLFNRYHVGLMAYGFAGGRRHTFDLYGVWSEYFRRRLLEGDLYNEVSTFVAGPLRPPNRALVERVSVRPRSGAAIRVLVLSEPRAPHEEVWTYVDRLLQDDRFVILLKLRPEEEQPYFAHAARHGAVRTLRTGSVFEAFEDCEVVLGTYSTVLYEAALALRPAVVLNTSFEYGYDIVRDGLADLATSPSQVSDVVVTAAGHDEAELIRRRDTIWGDSCMDGAGRLFDVAESELWERPGAS